MICDEHKFIYLPLDSDFDILIKELLIKNCSKYKIYTPEALAHESRKEKYKEYYKFTIIQDPFNRVYSLWKKLVDSKQTVADLNGFTDRIDHGRQAYEPLAPYLEKISTIYFNIDFNMIASARNLKNDLIEAFSETEVAINIPDKLPGLSASAYSWFSEKSIDKIKSFYNKDFEYFFAEYLYKDNNLKIDTKDKAAPKLTNSVSDVFNLKFLFKKYPHLSSLPFFNYLDNGIVAPSVEDQVYSEKNSGKKIAIASLYTPEIIKYAAATEDNFTKYCLKNNYTLHIYRENFLKNSHAGWSKPSVILNHLHNHEMVAWIDSDAIIVDFEKKLEYFIRKYPNKYIIAAQDLGCTSKDVVGQGTYLNSGVVFYRNHPYTFEILQKWKDFSANNPTPELFSFGGDQKILGDLIQSNSLSNQHFERCLMSEFNTWPPEMTKNSFILHFMAFRPSLKSIFLNYINHILR